MSEAIYSKVQRGKRVHYELVGNAAHWHSSDFDVLKPGQFRLEFASQNGMHRYAYPVSPDVAGWAAAAMLARDAMEAAMHKMAIAAPQLGSPVLYTKKQLAIIERYRAEMAAAGGMFPIWWQHTSSTEIAQAAIEAVREYKP